MAASTPTSCCAGCAKAVWLRLPEIIKGSRRKRIARGSGTSEEEVSQLVKQFQQMQRMMKQIAGKAGKGRGGIDPNELLRRLR